jgi:hypothetical protein
MSLCNCYALCKSLEICYLVGHEYWSLVLASPLLEIYFIASNILVCIVLFSETCCQASSCSTGLFSSSPLFRCQSSPFNISWCPAIWSVFIQWITCSSLRGSIYWRFSLSLQLWRSHFCWQSV